MYVTESYAGTPCRGREQKEPGIWQYGIIQNGRRSVSITFDYPFFAGPVGAVKLHYGEKYSDQEYNDILVSACAKSGIAAFTGDGTNYQVMIEAADAISKFDGMGIPTVKPWDLGTIKEKMELVKKSGAFAVAMDIDSRFCRI